MAEVKKYQVNYDATTKGKHKRDFKSLSCYPIVTTHWTAKHFSPICERMYTLLLKYTVFPWKPL